MKDIVAKCLWVRQFECDPGDVLSMYARAGYRESDELAEFVNSYTEMRFIWLYGDRMEVELTTDFQGALLVHKSNVRQAENKCGVLFWPVGEAFETFDAFLLGENGVFYLAGEGI
jgi:hypothetical protein